MSASRIRSAMPRTSSVSPALSHRITNSSPPRRATVSMLRTQRISRSAAVGEQLIAGAVTEASR